MRKPLCWIGNVSLAIGLLAGASSGHAQSARPWVDPPAGSGEPSKAPPSAPTPTAAQPEAPRPPSEISTAKDGEAGKQKQQQAEKPPSVQEEKPAVPPPARKTVTERKERREKTRAAARSERSVQTAQPRRAADRTTRLTREERVRQGVEAGLEVMTLRTIEFPDGRRVQILTRPRPGAVSEFMDAPQ